ncbi:hypothetical protein PMZ80_006177 [Knufia obscura]|nr:hypothetical protein PMZ80_006177 [Knufia obscura]
MSQTPSKACCNTPPVVSKGYKEKGQYTTVDGLKTYTTGPKSSSGILVVYDIFGFFPQTLQGADILSGEHHSEASRKFQIFMPDFFEGKPADISWYPPDTDEKGKKLGEFFNTTAAPPKTVERVGKVMQELKAKNPDIKNWGVLGYCWGGKIVNLVSQEGSAFKAAAACHPAMVDPKDAPQVTIPIMMLPSMDESKDDVNGYKQGLKVKNQIEWFDNQIHGFMAARGNLEDESVKKAYEQGYSMLSNWFAENL